MADAFLNPVEVLVHLLNINFKKTKKNENNKINNIINTIS
jgi:hypothetical protein